MGWYMTYTYWYIFHLVSWYSDIVIQYRCVFKIKLTIMYNDQSVKWYYYTVQYIEVTGISIYTVRITILLFQWCLLLLSYVYLVFKCAVIYYVYPPTCGKIDWHSLIECTVQNFIDVYISHITSWYSQYYNCYYSVMIGASLSEPHSSRRNGSYHGSLLTLVTCENILMDRKEGLRRRRDTFKLLERHQDRLDRYM